MTARLLGYLRHLMEVDPVVRKAGLRRIDHLQVSSVSNGEMMVAYLRTGSPRSLPPLRVPVLLLAEDMQSGYNGVKRCVYGWLETNVRADRRPERIRPIHTSKPRPSGPLGD